MNKKCTKCKTVKPISDFGKYSKSPDGFDYYCKVCRSIAVRRWQKGNPEKVAANRKKYKYVSTDESKAQAKEWRKANKEKVKEYNKRWQKENPKRLYEIIRKSESKYPEKRMARNAVRYAVYIGKLKPAKSFICSNCKINQARDYHHHKGYSSENWLDVVPLCRSCHQTMKG